MIFDVLLTAIFALLIFICYKHGAVRSLSRVIIYIVSYFSATIIGRLLADLSYQTYVKPAIEQSVSKSLENVSANTAEAVIEALPDWLTALIGMDKQTLLSLFSGPVSSANNSIIETVCNVVKPITMGLLSFFITILLFFAILMICRKILIRPLEKVFDLPVLKTVNHVVGGVVGFVQALLLVMMIAYLMRLILSNIGSTSAWLNEATINKSFIFKYLYRGNIFTWISSLIP